jgi:hypothetical protein
MPGPEAWANQEEIDRCRWDERFVGTEADGFNPIAQVEVRGGQTLETHAKLANHERLLKEKEAAYAKQHAAARSTRAAAVSAAAAGRGGNGATNRPISQRYGIQTEEQREARVTELTQKLGIDKVSLSQKPVDTTPQAGHHSASVRKPF